MKADPMFLAALGGASFPGLLIAFVFAISPFMNWLNGYGFVWIFE